jgi:CubicO group peptidase (beta-lactamase class C family)
MTNFNRLNKIITREMRDGNFPGMSITINNNDDALSTFCYGAMDKNGLLPVTSDTLFGVASLTKFMTALIIMQAQRLGLLSVTEPVAHYYPELHCAQDGQMRLEHLLTHSSGLPGLSCRFFAKDLAGQIQSDSKPQLLTTADLISHINQLAVAMLAPPGALHSYSNEGYCILGGIIETVFKLPYPEVAKKLVLGPLSMHNSAIGGQQAQSFGAIATPLQYTGQGLRELPYWDAPLFYPAGGLLTCPSDLIRLLSVLRGDSELLSQQLCQVMMTRLQPIASRPSLVFGYGYGLEIEQLRDDNILAWHTGQRSGLSSFFGIVPEQQLSVAITINASDAPTAHLGHTIFNDILSDFTDIDLPWLTTDYPDDPQRENPDQLRGRYGSLELGNVDVVYCDDQLTLQTSAGSYPFEFQGQQHGAVAGQTFQFIVNNQHRCTGLAFGLRVLPRLP